MAGLIPQSFIDDLLDRLDIVDVVDSRVKLRKSGKNYSACCPFHDEKSPSFTVSPDKQFFYCFGCGASGNALGFIMDYERLSFPEAVENLAHLAGLDVPREVKSEAQVQREQERKNIYDLLEKANHFYQHQLRHHATKAQAVNYLKNRGLDGKTAKDYQVGFAPAGWDNLLKAIGTTDDDKRLLIEGGLLIHHAQESKLYDRFRHRIMFPIRDARGRVIGFGGRVLGDDKPKYLNSPETPVFHKGKELYGLYEARHAYRELPRLLVVEGYMDVVSLAQFGIRYGVATLGTACGPDHLDRAFKHTNEVVFCFDGDHAGRNAAQRALEASLGVMTDGRTVKFLFLPDGEDPDTLVRQIGADKFERMIELAVPLEDYLFDAVAEGLNIRSMDGRATFAKRAAPLLDRLPKGVFRELMFESLATRTGLQRKLLEELVLSHRQSPEPIEAALPRIAEASQESHEIESLSHNDIPSPPPDYQEYFVDTRNLRRPAPTASQPSRYLMPPARKAIALLLMYPSLASLETDHDLWLSYEQDQDCLTLGRLLKVLHERPHYNLSHLIGYWRGTYGSEATEHIARIAGHDLLQAANALTRARADKPAKADYDTEMAFISSLAKLREQIQQRRNQEALTQLKRSDFHTLSKEEQAKLIAQALTKKGNSALH